MAIKKHEYDYEFPWAMAAPKSTVFRALTDPMALATWFAEHVEVEPVVGGPFRFWGRHTYGVPSKADASGALLRYDPPEAISFSWQFLGQDTEVTWSLREYLEDDTPKTRIRVRHVFDALPDTGRAESLIDDLWRIHTGNLCCYVGQLPGLYRPDFADQNPEVRCETIINAPPEKVFAALVTPEYISQWFPAPNPIVEPRVGGKYGFGYSYEVDGETVEPPPMKILAFEENRRLAFTWPDWRGDPQVPDQRVSWLLEDLGSGRTRLTLVHDGFTREVDVSDYPFGWRNFLDKIGKVATDI